MDFEIPKPSLNAYPTLKYDENRRTLLLSNFQEQSIVVCTNKYRANEDLKNCAENRINVEAALH